MRSFCLSRRSLKKYFFFSKKALTNGLLFAIILALPCESGGTGRRARLRGVWFTPYGFKSRFSHQQAGMCGSIPPRPQTQPAGMAELADALDSGSSESNFMKVQVLLPAPNQYNPNQIFLIGDGFGLFVYFEKFENTHFRNGIIKRPESKPRGPRKPKKQT